MGTNTDAILVWGFDLAEIDNDHLRVRVEYLVDDGYDELAKIEKKTGAELVYHCSGSCPMYIVGVTKTKTKAWRGEPIEIKTLDHAKNDQSKLDAFAEAIGAKPRKGRWLLASWWSS